VPDKTIDSYILGKINKREMEGRLTVFLYTPLAPTYDNYGGIGSGAYRQGNKIWINGNEIADATEDIIANSGKDPIRKLFFKEISEQYHGNRQAISDDIYYTFKTHEAKGHLTCQPTIQDEERALLFEIKEAKSKYPVFRVWNLTNKADWLHGKAARIVMQAIFQEMCSGKKANMRDTGEFLANSDLAPIRQNADYIFTKEFGG